jgi:hypothetical protein
MQTECEALLASTSPGVYIDYHLSFPKWQFLNYLCSAKELVLHGSQNNTIHRVEPRKALDVRDFSAQEMIYATTDGIWVMFFAIIDRMNYQPLSLYNSCLQIRISAEEVLGPLYLFSITYSALLKKPWCEGTIYILPRQSFSKEPSQQMMGTEITFPHWISSLPADPVAKLKVTPQDFPFLEQIHGHDDEKLTQHMAANPDGFPWPETWLV